MTAEQPHPVLVTGATGFIGRRLVDRLIERRHPVFCLFRAGCRADAVRMTKVRAVLGDVTDPSSIQSALATSRPSVVFHLAGLVRARSVSDFMAVNAGGVEVVAAACAAHARPPTLVVVSSLAAAGPCPADQIRVEADVPSPRSAYGRSKLAGEHAAAKYAGTVPTTVVRPPVVFGPGDRAVLEVFRSVSRWGVHVVPGRHGGDRRVSLVHVDDLVEGLLLAAADGERMREGGPLGEGVYFMAGNDCPTYAALGRAIATALGRKPPTIVRVPGPMLRLLGIGGDLMGRVRRHPSWINSDKLTEALAAGWWTCSSAKARDQLGWTPPPPGALDDQLRKTAEGYRQSGWL